MRRGEIGRLARWLEVTPRTLNNWKRAWRPGDGARRPPGRPPHDAAAHDRARELVRRELEVQGWGAGERPLWRALGVHDVPLRLVREELRSLKAEHRRRHGRARRAARRGATVLARDAVWSLDGTHLGRDRHGEKVIAEAVRDVASSRTLGASLGPPAAAEEVATLLALVVRERGSAPLVLSTDNGGENQAAVDAWCARHQVVHLRNVPRVPQHNPWIEHGFAELKRETSLGRGVRIAPGRDVPREVLGAWRRIDGGRLRATRGWRTAIAVDRTLPLATRRVPRTRFHNAARCALAQAVRNCRTARERRLAEREAILRTLECYKLVRRTRGHDQSTPVKSEVVS